MKQAPRLTHEQWVKRWLDGVVSGAATMSQRSLASIEARGGGIEFVRSQATQRGVHLLLLQDDQGKHIVAASMRPFHVLC